MKFITILAMIIIGFLNVAVHAATSPPALLKDVEIKSLKVANSLAKGTANYLLKSENKKKFPILVQNEIKEKLKDPDSAKFRNFSIKKYHEGFLLCGEFNAKNSYGGYIGYKKFYAGVVGEQSSLYTIIIEEKTTNGDADDLAVINAGFIDVCQSQ